MELFEQQMKGVASERALLLERLGSSISRYQDQMGKSSVNDTNVAMDDLIMALEKNLSKERSARHVLSTFLGAPSVFTTQQIARCYVGSWWVMRPFARQTFCKHMCASPCSHVHIRATLYVLLNSFDRFPGFLTFFSVGAIHPHGVNHIMCFLLRNLQAIHGGCGGPSSGGDQQRTRRSCDGRCRRRSSSSERAPMQLW